MKKKPRGKGEIGVTASVGGRLVTLDPIRVLTLSVPAREVESTISCGFRMEWMSGNVDGEMFVVTSGAGCGSQWLTFDYKGRRCCVDGEDIVKAFIAAIENVPPRGATPGAWSST